MTMKQGFKELEERLLTETRKYYSERLVAVVVFGSVGRGAQRYDSDLDVMIVAEGLPAGRMKRIIEFDSTVEAKLEPFMDSLKKNGINTYVSAIIKSPDEIKAGTPLLIDMIEDSRILYDREGFFFTALERQRKRLEDLGAKRIWRGNAWYWILKPDYRSGEVFEI